MAWLGIAAIVLATAQVAVSPYPRGPHAQVTIPGQPPALANPVAWSGVPGLVRWSVVLLPVAIALSLAALVVRWRRSAGIETAAAQGRRGGGGRDRDPGRRRVRGAAAVVPDRGGGGAGALPGRAGRGGAAVPPVGCGPGAAAVAGLRRAHRVHRRGLRAGDRHPGRAAGPDHRRPAGGDRRGGAGGRAAVPAVAVGRRPPAVRRPVRPGRRGQPPGPPRAGHRGRAGPGRAAVGGGPGHRPGAAAALRAHHHRRRARQRLRRAGRGRLAAAPGPRRGGRG